MNTSTAKSLRPPARRLQVPVVAVGVLALAVGCGSSGNSSNTTPASPGQGTTSGGSGPGGTNARPGTTGTISQVNPSSIYVQNPSNGQVTVNYSASTTFSQTVPSTAGALKVGNCVTATAAAASDRSSAPPAAPITSLTATAVTITATSGKCTRGGGGFGGAGTRPSGAPRANRSGAPGPGGFGRAAFGTVASVGNGSFVVNSVRGGNANDTVTKITVTTTPTTTYRQIRSATKADLKVGLCATAIGKTDDTGAVTARSIALSTPGKNGCTARFGGGRFGAGGAT